MNLRITILLMLGVLVWSDSHAQSTATATMRVSATVEDFCGVTTPDYVPRDTSMRVQATCSPRATYHVLLNKGLPRHAAPVAPALTGVGTGEPVDHTLFGGVPSSQLVPPVDVADTVSVRVYY